MYTSSVGSLRRLAWLWILTTLFLFGQTAEQRTQMSAAWDQVITNAVPQTPPNPALARVPSEKAKDVTGGFLMHFFLESRSNYEHDQTGFAGNSTNTGVIDAPLTGVFNPAGIPSPTAFQPGANRVEEFLDFGTRGYGSDRVNTHFALRYRQDLSTVDPGSSAANIIETQYGNRLYELLDASVEINGKPTDGAFAGSSLLFGRINVYGAELASLDGASVTIGHPQWDLTLYGGRRFTFFADPIQRAIGGANLVFKLNPDTSIAFETLWYIEGAQRLSLRKRLHERWLLSSNLRAYGGSPTELDASLLYSSRTGRDSLLVGLFRKLTDNGYTYDYTTDARNASSNNPLVRLYLGPIDKYTQFSLEAHHQFLKNLRAGGSFVVRCLDNQNDSTPFETSFRDYRASVQYYLRQRSRPCSSTISEVLTVSAPWARPRSAALPVQARRR